jgi:serine/threonine-protein kinase
VARARYNYVAKLQAQAISEPAPPRRIGKYEVLGELGHGGMAVVYRARDTQLRRDVAIKVLHPHLASDPQSPQRFLREAQAAARLRHPHIVEVFDFAVESDRDSFMVSELLEGPTLRRFADEHPGMPAEVAAAIGIVLCQALACAHEQGVIHRDVKPDNILLAKGGVLKLTDFGIAHVADGGGMTVTGQVLGSPAHMAPEQIDGRRIDARADLFAAGTVLYVLAVGRLPFEAPNAHALLRKILEADYPDPLRAAPGIGHRLGAIVRKCLERDPEKRYASAKALENGLREFVAESGWKEPEKNLREYFEDPEKFTAGHRAKLLETLPDLGVKARKAGRLPDALGYFNRALAIDPANVKVLGLVRGISRRRRMERTLRAVGVIALTAAASALTVVGGVKWWAKTHPVEVAVTPRVEPETHGTPVVAGSATSPQQTAVVADASVGNGENSATTTTTTNAAAAAADAGSPTSPATSASSGTARTTTTSTRSTTARTTQANAHTTGSGDPTGTVTAVRTTRAVRLIISPQGVDYSIDGGARVQYGPDTIQVSLRPGPHTFHVEPHDPRCRPFEWTETIEPDPDPGHPSVRPVRKRLPPCV